MTWSQYLETVARFRGPTRGYDRLLVCGALLIALLAVLGRSPLTVSLALAYLAVVLGYVGYITLRGGQHT